MVIASGRLPRRNGTMAASPANPNQYKIDVGRYVTEMEHILRANGDRIARRKELAILNRWRFDEMLDYESRQRAKLLVSIFARNE
jgi:hypothetical protein